MFLSIYYLTFILASVGMFLVWRFLYKKKNEIRFFKTISLTLAGIFCLWYYSGSEQIAQTVLFANSPLSNGFLTFVSLFAIWFQFASVLLLIIYPYFKDNKIIVHFVKFFALPVSLLNLLTFVPQTWGIGGMAVTHPLYGCAVFVPLVLVV